MKKSKEKIYEFDIELSKNLIHVFKAFAISEWHRQAGKYSWLNSNRHITKKALIEIEKMASGLKKHFDEELSNTREQINKRP